MNFIEALFHVSPDDGSGTLEVMILSALCAALMMLAVIIINVRPKRGRPRALLKASIRMLE